MKKIAILTLLATPAFANQIPFNDPTFLKLANGDRVKAQVLSRYCQESGKPTSSCVASLKGSGNLQQEAAQNCMNKAVNSSLEFSIKSNSKEIPGSRMHKAEGVYWHPNYVKSPESGRLHRHEYSDRQRDEAFYGKLTYELNQAKSRLDAVTDSSSVTKEKGSSIAYTVEAVIKMISAGGQFTQSESAAIAQGTKIPSGEIDEALRKARLAKDDPSIMNIDPEILCYIDERDCSVGSNGKITNTSYDPNYKEAEKDKKDDKKGAENPPKHEDDHTPDIPDIISDDGGELWAGNDTGTPDTVIATPVLDESLAPKSAMESCVEKETKRLNDEFGKTTIDENKLGEEDERKQRAESLLKTGYCQESYYGQEFCAKHAFQQDSVVAIDIKSEREAAAKAALERFQATGICSPALGSDFCKKAREKWQKTPAGEDPATNPTPSGGKGVKLPDGRVITLPGSPVKSGDLPRKNP